MILTLRQARRLTNITQKELADLLKICVNTYQKLEKSPDLVTIGQAKKISEFLDIPYDEIFFGNHIYFK